MSLCSGLISSSIWGNSMSLNSGIQLTLNHYKCNRATSRVYAMSNDNPMTYKMNLNEYMVTLKKPLGIRFALSVDGKVFIHSLRKGGNAEKSRIIMVGDTLKKTSNSSHGQVIEVKDIGDAQNMLKEKNGSFSLVLERPFTPFPIQELLSTNDLDIMFNRGRVPVATWSKTLLASDLQGSCESNSNSGFIVFSPKFLVSRAWKMLSGQNGHSLPQLNTSPATLSPLACIFTEEDSIDAEWAHGSFPLGEYTDAIDRAKGEIYYNHSLGMQYSKGITAVLNFQSPTEAENWGINSDSIKECCQRCNILMINYPIREGDSYDARKKLPFSVGLLLRLLKKNHRVFITCTSGFDRSPACVIAYLHWITDTSLNAAYNFVTGLHSSRPNRPAIAWATWDLIAMVEKDRHDCPATHAVTFVWSGQEGEDVCLVGDFTGNWKDPIKAVHKGGPRYEIEVRLPHGKYYYKYIINGQWRHSPASPTERDERGNVNNVIKIGDTASVRPSVRQHEKDANIVKVIERQLTENERFMLAKAARCIAFSICPIRLVPK
ncbi:Phosphoglucan phosphatase LSF1 chloroplastic [Bienertia sinuspersici]